MKRQLQRILTVFTILAALMSTGLAAAAVDPPEVTATLAPGQSMDVTKTVDVPEAAPKADVYFLADTTGSMGSVLSAVKADAAMVLSTIEGMIADVQFGAGQYKDFPHDPFAFSSDAPIGLDDGVGGTFDASDAINAWAAGGGSDIPEGQLFALDRIADPSDPTGIAWRPDSSKIVVWFGDAPGHDPVCAAISGLAFDITEASATTKLVNAGITVVAISTTTGTTGALDGNPAAGAGDYSGFCVIGGSTGQATRITAATSGVHLTGVTPSEIADAILAGIAAITFDITAEPVGCDPLEVTFDPPSHEDVVGPAQVQFTETITVPPGVTAGDLPPGGVVECTVEFKASGAVIGVQKLTITVPTEAEEVAGTIDFEGLAAGSIVNSVAVGSGISLDDPSDSVDGAVSVLGTNPRFVENAAMIYDSTNLTGDDEDLFGFDENKNLLIISEDLDQTDPDDNKTGGDLALDFTAFGPGEVSIQSLEVFDIDPYESAGTIVFEKSDGNLVTMGIPITGNHGTATVGVSDGASVTRMTVTLDGSGAIDNIRFLVKSQSGNPSPLAFSTQLWVPMIIRTAGD